MAAYSRDELNRVICNACRAVMSIDAERGGHETSCGVFLALAGSKFDSRGRENHTYTNSSPFACPVCSKPQRTEGWLHWHLRNYHPQARETLQAQVLTGRASLQYNL
ncbi:hypothetical protein LCGC14_2331920 [marine sediment metagenome]|uniref:C2H2-type domain-containing protein n=1 Tax=marine sediment metagenome TaxID=412755 RepID=A0A0F9F9L1_9ZZZZ